MKLILLLLLSLPTFAATTANLVITGFVPAILSISVAPEIIATTLPLDITQTNTKIATVTERSNNHAGHKVTIVSANQGKLLLDVTNFVIYTLTYNNLPVNLAGTTTFNYVFTNASPQLRDVKISYNGTPNEDMANGSYTDTLTFTIIAN